MGSGGAVDIPGTCIANDGVPPTGAFCAGRAGLACPLGQVCIDKPDDSCDPDNGGNDCGGICVNGPR